MATFTLPQDGEVPWTVNPAILAINTQLETVAGDVSSRLSPQALEDTIEGTTSGLSTRVTNLETNAVSKASLDSETADNIGDSGSDTFEALNQFLGQTTASFPFDEVEANYGLRVGGAGTTRVMQSISVTEKPDGYILTSYALEGSVSPRETTLVVLHSAAGRSMGEMRFTDAGHGTGVFLEVTPGGDIFVWLSYINYGITSGLGRFNYVRVPWSAGTTYTWATAEAYKVNALSRSGYLTAHFDERNGVIGVREDTQAGLGGSFTVHTMSALKAGTWNPLSSMAYTYPTGAFIQGWAYLDGYWYIYSGSSESTTPYAPAEILQVDAATGALRTRRTFEEIRNSVTGSPLYGFSEPEGIAVGRGYGGDPSLIVGVSSGAIGGRSHTLWWIGKGFTPFRNAGQSYDYYAGSTDWTSYPLTPASGITLDTTESIGFGVRRVGEYLEMRGVVNGTFPSGTTNIGQLLEGFYHPVRQLRGVVSKSSVTASPSASARVDVNPTGGVSVTLPAGASGSAGWIDFTGFRAPLN